MVLNHAIQDWIGLIAKSGGNQNTPTVEEFWNIWNRLFSEFDVEDSEWRRPRVTETSAGHDIFFRNEYYGTVLITDNQLIVFQTDPHFLECYARFMGISRSHTEANLLELKTRRDEINNQIESSTDKLQYSEELKEIEEEIEEEEEELSEVSELQEKIEKWSNWRLHSMYIKVLKINIFC